MKNLPRLRFFHHETHMEWPRREFGTPAVGGNRPTAYVAGLPHNMCIKVVEDWGFTTLLTTHVINFAFYSKREKWDKFCSGVGGSPGELREELVA